MCAECGAVTEAASACGRCGHSFEQTAVKRAPTGEGVERAWRRVQRVSLGYFALVGALRGALAVRSQAVRPWVLVGAAALAIGVLVALRWRHAATLGVWSRGVGVGAALAVVAGALRFASLDGIARAVAGITTAAVVVYAIELRRARRTIVGE